MNIDHNFKLYAFPNSDLLATSHLNGIYFHINRLLKVNQTAALEHFKRIADYLELGEGVWYKCHDSEIEFLDGSQEEDYKGAGPVKTHFR